MDKLTQKLKQLRWSQNMTMKEFANSIGINELTYQQYDLGYRKVSLKLLKQLVLVYKIDLNEWILEVGCDSKI